MAKNVPFGEYLRELRIKTGYGLRTFAKKIDMQPSNLSALENGRAHPPRDKDIQLKVAEALGLKKGSSEWGRFFDLAVDDIDRIPADIAADEHLRNYLPVMMRTVANSRLSVKEIKELVDRIRKYRPTS